MKLTRELANVARYRSLSHVTLLVLLFPFLSSGWVWAQECGKSGSEIYERVSPYVATIVTMSIDKFDLARRVRTYRSSGMIVSNDGLIVTNHHAVLDARIIDVSLDDKTFYRAELVAADPVLDLAILKAPIPNDRASRPKFGNSSKLKIGQSVYAIGNALGLGKTLSSGLIAGLDRIIPLRTTSWLTPHIQTDAAINPGNSGGPLIDDCGNVVGINVLASRTAENIGWAIPSNIVERAIAELIEKKRVVRVWHGLYGRTVNLSLGEVLNIPLVEGFLVETVEPGSAADKAGLRGGEVPIIYGRQQLLLGGDVIVRVNDTKLSSIDAVLSVLRSLKVGDTIEVEYFRNGVISTTSATLSERPLLQGELKALRSGSQRTQSVR